MESSQVPTIPEFFRDREIFITGGTGFLGKAIIEKILYSCPDVHRIYLLIRCKKGVEIHDRMKKFKDDQIFNRIKEKDEKLLDKLLPVAGDLISLRLGLSDEDLKKMENVSVILNSAATVRFDETLHDAILTNTRSARELVLIAEKLKNLKILVHISTTFCNPTYKVIEEEVYPPLADWRQAIKLAENLDEDTLDTFSEKYMNFQPNTYTFTKGLTEQIMKEYSEKLPIIIFRPSMISPSVKEPYPGWVDNFNGLAGIIAIGSSGLGRVFYNNLKINANCQPLDVCVRSLLVATWKHSLALNTNLTTYNCACNKEKCLSTSSIFNEFYGMVSKIPVDEMIWYPTATITPYYILYKILFFFFQIIPGIFFDMIFRFWGPK
ncbi:fatty acyl-CoA reductase wat-like [Lutzomyia longipalpis]|uniref:fatty acyl-CoA reductase wat-like n=1 Tax=Lutzomyia longipalpis TaxID=7200 RepID=UPI0024838547|nr:fatty acyl-CoA reductase wat-like [Lutzomyia longipalpis]